MYKIRFFRFIQILWTDVDSTLIDVDVITYGIFPRPFFHVLAHQC